MTEAEVKSQILDQVGDRGKDAAYELHLPLSTSGGLWRLAFANQWTPPLAYPTTREDVQAALAALPSINDPNGVEVIGARGGPYRIFMQGSMGKQLLDKATFPFEADGSQLIEASELKIEQTQPGRSQMLRPTIETLWAHYGYIQNIEVRALFCKRDLLIDLRAEAQKLVDTTTQDRKESASQQFRALTTLYNEVEAKISALTGGSSNGTSGPTSAVEVGRIQKRTPNHAAYGHIVLDPLTGEIY